MNLSLMQIFPLRVLLIGLGKIGMGYDLGNQDNRFILSHAKAIHLHPQFEIAAAIEKNSERRLEFEKHYNKPSFSKISEIYNKDIADIAIIATPTSTHGKILKRIIKNKLVDFVLCEKPLSYNIDEAQSMINLCHKTGTKLFVNYMRRVDPAAKIIKQRIDSGAINMPIKGNCWYSKGLIHNGSHMFNLIEFWLGRLIDFTIIGSNGAEHNRDPELDFAAFFELGSIVFQAAWEEHFSHYTIELLSPSGRIRYDEEGFNVSWQTTKCDLVFNGHMTLDKELECLDSQMHKYQFNVLESIIEEYTRGKSSLCTGKDALITLESLNQVASKGI